MPVAKRIALAQGLENYNILQNNGRIAHQVSTLFFQYSESYLPDCKPRLSTTFISTSSLNHQNLIKKVWWSDGRRKKRPRMNSPSCMKNCRVSCRQLRHGKKLNRNVLVSLEYIFYILVFPCSMQKSHNPPLSSFIWHKIASFLDIESRWSIVSNKASRVNIIAHATVKIRNTSAIAFGKSKGLLLAKLELG